MQTNHRGGGGGGFPCMRGAQSPAMDGSEAGGGAERPEAGAGKPAPQEQRFGLRTGQVRLGCGKRYKTKTGGADNGGRNGFQTETLPLLRGRDRARLPVRLPPVGDLLASPVPEPAESFFLQAEHREERGLSPGQGAGVLVPHPARAQPELLLPQLQAAPHPGGRVPHPVATTWYGTKKRARL